MSSAVRPHPNNRLKLRHYTTNSDYWRSRLTQSFSVEGVAEDHPFVKDPNQRWDVGVSEIVEPPDRKIPYQPSAARIGREGTNFREYVDPRGGESACRSG